MVDLHIWIFVGAGTAHAASHEIITTISVYPDQYTRDGHPESHKILNFFSRGVRHLA